MPFGLTNDPNTFTCLVNQGLRPVIPKLVIIYFDDILIHSKYWEEHMEHLRAVFNLLGSNWVYAHPMKCEFIMEGLIFLGYVVRKDEIK